MILTTLWSAKNIWLAIGFGGQFLFFLRFFVQWLVSEKEKRSVIPEAFWYFSITGGAVLFIYAVFGIHDPVFAVGQGTGLLIYVRNLYFILRAKREAKTASG
jgi:lipid-A-disaccharide synthase-like uncharacterized protein